MVVLRYFVAVLVLGGRVRTTGECVAAIVVSPQRRRIHLPDGTALVGASGVVVAVQPADEDFTSPDVGLNRRVSQTCLTQLTLEPREFNA